MALKIAIEAGLIPHGQSGGVEQFVMGLVHGLGRLTDGDDEYIVITNWRHEDWLKPFLGSNQRLIAKPDNLQLAHRLLGPFRGPAKMMWRAGYKLFQRLPALHSPGVPESDGFYESLGANVIHFPFQHFVRSKLPTVFNPHDLLHEYFPELCSPGRLRWRQVVYREACLRASAVAAESHAFRKDLVRFYGLSPAKVFVIHRGSPTALFPVPTRQDIEAIQRKYGLPDRFALYPAQTWPHKNHARLLEAIKSLRDSGKGSVNLVCAGRKNDSWAMIDRRIAELGLTRHVFFPGYIEPSELRAFYASAAFLVFPSLVESGGFPVVEAFQEGTPVACSAIPALQEYGADAALYFDPESTGSIATALERMWNDGDLRSTLRGHGARRIRLFDWQQTARMYRALYRRAAGRPLSEEDDWLLTAQETSIGAQGVTV